MRSLPSAGAIPAFAAFTIFQTGTANAAVSAADGVYRAGCAGSQNRKFPVAPAARGR